MKKDSLKTESEIVKAKKTKKVRTRKVKPKPTLEEQLYALAKEQHAREKWYKLDNNATIFPIMAGSEGKSTFRLAVKLVNKVDPIALQKAVNKIIARFPTMTGAIKRGLFWHYIDKPLPVVVTKQQTLSTTPFQMDGRRSQIRVFYNEYTVAVEFFHSATDGTGGIVFLNSLLAQYFTNVGEDVGELVNTEDLRDIPTVEEMSDAIPKIAERGVKIPPVMYTKARVLKGTKLPENTVLPIIATCSATELKALAQSYGAKVGELLTATLLVALAKQKESTIQNDNRPTTVMLPVNLRKVYGINTLRNFTNFLVISGSTTDLPSAISLVREQKEQMNTKEFHTACMSPNYFNANSRFLKIAPLWLKTAVIKSVTKKRGGGIVNTSTLSNLGRVCTPKSFEKLVLRYEFLLGQEKNPPVVFSSICFGDVCTIGVTDKLEDHIVERYFFRTLAELGLNITVEAEKTEGLL